MTEANAISSRPVERPARAGVRPDRGRSVHRFATGRSGRRCGQGRTPRRRRRHAQLAAAVAQRRKAPAFSENFASLNRNKRTITFDLKNQDDLAQLRRSCSRSADVVVENFRAGVLQRLGLGYEELCERNPKLVYCSISGYGQTGPYAEQRRLRCHRAGHQRHHERHRRRRRAAGQMRRAGRRFLRRSVCGLLYYSPPSCRHSATASGSYIDCSMLGSADRRRCAADQRIFRHRQQRRGALGSAHPRNAPYQAFQANDDYFVIAAGNDRLWQQVARPSVSRSWPTIRAFTTQTLRAKNQHELVDILNPLFLQKTAAEWLEDMDRRGVPCAPINDYPQILSDPQVAAMELVRPLRLPNGVETKTTAFPIGISGYRFEVYREPPELGADNETP